MWILLLFSLCQINANWMRNINKLNNFCLYLIILSWFNFSISLVLFHLIKRKNIWERPIFLLYPVEQIFLNTYSYFVTKYDCDKNWYYQLSTVAFHLQKQYIICYKKQFSCLYEWSKFYYSSEQNITGVTEFWFNIQKIK